MRRIHYVYEQERRRCTGVDVAKVAAVVLVAALLILASLGLITFFV
jgi:hypothetical protein